MRDTGFGIRGVIEGFYGRPWGTAARLGMAEFLGGHGFNLYVYAPKDDPFHRRRWWEPYPGRFVEHFRGLARRCRQNGVRACYSLSPGLSIDYRDPSALDAAARKLEVFAGAGAEGFALLFDDLPEESTSAHAAGSPALALAQAGFAEAVFGRLRGRCPEATLMLCPTHYCGDPRGDPYLEALGQSLERDVLVFWTGPDVCSRRIDVTDAQSFARVLRREPLYWDNYPVNDGGMRWELHIAPVQHRNPDLSRKSAGLVANGMSQCEAGKIPLATIGDFLTAPHDYDPWRSWEKALGSVAADLAGDVGLLGVNAQHSCLCESDSPQLDALEAELDATGYADDRLLAKALGVFGRFLTAGGNIERLGAGNHPPAPTRTLSRQLSGWARKMRLVGDLGETSCRALRNRWTGPREALTIRVLLRVVRRNRYRVSSRLAQELARRALLLSRTPG